MTVNVVVRPLRLDRLRTAGTATATATLRGIGGLPTTVKQKVRLAVAKKGTCNILTLTLDTLDLKLLGLDVHLDKVDLRVTGSARAACSAASSASSPARRSDRVGLGRRGPAERRLRRRRSARSRSSVPVRATAAQTTGTARCSSSCSAR